MKKYEIVNLFNYFSNLKLNKFSKKLRSKLVHNFDLIGDVKNRTDADVNGIRMKLFSEDIENIQKLITYRQEFESASEADKIKINNKIESECQPALKIELDFIKQVNDLYNQEIDLKLEKIEKELFVEECVNAGIDITLSELTVISSIFN